MFGRRPNPSRKSEDIKKSAAKVLDAKKDTPTRARHLRLFLDNAENPEILLFFENHYSHVFFIVYDAFIGAEINLRQKGAHKSQREELEAVLYLLEKVLLFLPEHLGRKWQYHAMGRLMSKLLHPGNSWKLIKREAMRLFLLWYQILGDVAGEHLHAMFATLVPGFPSPYQGLGLTALAAMTPEDGPINPAEICPLIPPQSGERWKSPETDLTRIFLDVLLELMVTQIPLIEWKDDVGDDRQRQCFDFLFERFKMYYMPHIFPDFNWHMSLYRPSLELPEVRHFRPNFVDSGDGTKKLDPMLACRVVVIKWVAQFTHLTRNATSGTNVTEMEQPPSHYEDGTLSSNGIAGGPTSLRLGYEGQMVRDILYGSRENVNFVHEVYRQAFLLSFSHSPAIKKVISVYKDWIQMNVSELPPFLLEPPPSSAEREREELRLVMAGKYPDSLDATSYMYKDQLSVRAGLQNVLQIFVTNAANVFLLEVSSEYPILMEEQVEMCKRVLNIYRYMVMNVKMEARTWEQLLFILLQITQLTLNEQPPRKREDSLGGRLAQAIFQTLIVTWIKANLYVVVSSELWDQFLEVLSSLTLWEELIREWAKTMETLTRVLARQVYNLDLNDLPLERLNERALKKTRGKERPQSELKNSNSVLKTSVTSASPQGYTKVKLMQQLRLRTQSICTSSPSTEASLRSASALKNSRQRSTSECSETHPQPPPRKQKKQKKSVDFKAGLHRSLSESNVISSLRYGRPQPLEIVEVLKRSKSLDFEYGDRLRGRFSDSQPLSRSCSPTASSGLECVSMKDSPMMNLDNDTMSEAGSLVSDMFSSDGGHHRSLSASASSSSKSVMSGGSVKGWLPDVAVVLWRRMLGSLGNINTIQDPVIHAQIYKYLIELFEILAKIRNNQGVSLDNLSTPKPPDYVPPFTIFAPWCFRSLQMQPEDTFQRGRLYALRLLCMATVRPHDSPVAKTHLVQFYKVLHTGLTDQSRMDEMYTLIRFTGPRFFSLMLPGYTAYILDFLYAANSIISNSDLKGVPRTEATSIVGSLLAFPPMLQTIPLLLPNPHELTLISSTDVKDQIIGVLLKSGKKEPAGLARCISLSSLGLFVYAELLNESLHGKIKEAIQVLLTALRFNNKAVAQIASDMVLLLADHVERLLEFYPEVPKKIVEVLARTLTSLIPSTTADLENDEKRLLLALINCLGEWVMKLPKFMLTHPQEDGKPLLYHVFASLYAASGVAFRPTKAEKGPAVMMTDFDPNVHMQETLENSQHEQDLNHTTSEDMEVELRSPVRLAAKALISHCINHLFHFPMENGAANLNSMVSEHDDNKINEELTIDALNSPNVQLFVINECTLMSLVELPILTSQSVAGVKTAETQVRIILRDISGKFCWESTALYNSEDSTMSNDDGSIELPEWPPTEAYENTQPKSFSQVQALRHRQANVLPSYEDAAEDLDNLNDLLQYIGHTSPECLVEPGRPLNAIISAGHFLDPVMEKEMIAGVLGQRTLEQEHVQSLREVPEAALRPPTASVSCDNSAAFQQSRRWFSQLGLLSWEKRSKVHLVRKTDRLLRELKNLDNKRPREAHKIAVIYVAEGQEDKQSILGNSCGSSAFEDFVAGLGWEVELETHTGFMGGLSKSKATGETAPYFATSFVEVMFHVATRMPSHSDEGLITKTRHLGNDEVHIVWSEHSRDYRREILPTEFCDVLIIIYPLKNDLFRIQVSRKGNVPFFGPLFNEIIVEKRTLPGLVRATAINASRAKRSMIPHYQSYYEERFYSLDQIIKNHKEKSTFEDFVTSTFSPSPLNNLFMTEAHSRPSSVASHSLISESASDISSEAVLRPRARTDASAMSNSTISTNLDQSSDQTDAKTPTNLNKLTERIRANLNNNVVRGNRPREENNPGGVVVTANQASPPLNASGKKR